MGSLFLILFFISFLALLIGLIKPNIVLKWLPEAKRNRKSVAMYFGIAAVVFFILFGATASPTNDSADADNNDQIEQEEKAKEEELKKEQEEKIKEEELKKEQEEKAKEEELRIAEEEELKKEQEEKAKEEARKKEQEEKAKKEEQENAETKSQQQAVKMAQNYISYTAFSKSGLIDQLEFEGFDNEDASYAVEKIDVNWKEQAVIMAENYLDYTAFSRSGLIEQLKFEGFSDEIATYAVNEVGL